MVLAYVVCKTCGKAYQVRIVFRGPPRSWTFDDFLDADRSDNFCRNCGMSLVDEIAENLRARGILG